jgi:amidase
MTHLLDADATDQANAIRRGELSCAELVDAAIARAEERNSPLNAVIRDRFDQARLEATQVDPTAPFAGVPIVVKDLTLQIAGESLYMGTRGLRTADYRAPVDSYTYESLCRAGFVTIGRTNTPEFGTTITTEPLSYGASRNPWNTGHSTGGSSGGSAAAVAAGIVAVGHANDGGGSIRIPASECGLVGLKPTRGRVSHGPTMAEGWMGSTTCGAVTRSVRDAAAVLWAMQGPKPGDPYGAPTPTRPYPAEVGVDPGSLRIGFVTTPQPGHGLDPACAAAVTTTAELLSSLGHRVSQDAPEPLWDSAFGDQFVTILMANVANDVAALNQAIAGTLGRPLGTDDLEPENLFYAAMGESITATAYLQATDWLHEFQRRMASWWEPSDRAGHGFDLLLTPTIGTAPPPIGWIGDPGAAPGFRVREVMQFTAQFNVTGQPAISLPLHVSPEGLPIGVQLVAGFGREDLLIRVAAQLEAASPWAHLAPAYR